jgi:ABC-type uncharacterized transport system substrate-binding protein
MRANKVITFILSVWTAASFLQAAPLKVSVIMPSTGYFAKMGTGVYQGILAAREMYPELKKNVEIKWVPSSESISTLALDAEKNIAESKPDLVVGGVTSLQAISISQITEKHNIPLIAPYATNPTLNEGKRNVFTLCFNDDAQALALAKIAALEKIKEVAILYSRGDMYSEYLKDKFKEYASKSGIKIVDVIGIDLSRNNGKELKAKVAGKNYKAYFMPFYQMSARTLLNQLMKLSPDDTVFLGTDSWAVDKQFIEEFKESGGKRRAIYVDHWNRDARSPLSESYTKFRANPPASMDPSLFNNTGMALGVDIGIMLKEITKHKDYSDLGTRISKISFNGLSGKTSYRRKNTPQKDIHFFQISSEGAKYMRSLRSQ